MDGSREKVKVGHERETIKEEMCVPLETCEELQTWVRR
jgi:hypothetical protein